MINSHIIQLLAPKIQTFPSGKEFIYLVGPIKLPVNLDGETKTFQWYSWMKSDKAMESGELIESLAEAELAERQQSSVLVYGDFADAQEALIRMHSICHTGDIFGSKRCDCGFQLEQSMKMIAALMERAHCSILRTMKDVALVCSAKPWRTFSRRRSGYGRCKLTTRIHRRCPQL